MLIAKLKSSLSLRVFENEEDRRIARMQLVMILAYWVGCLIFIPLNLLAGGYRMTLFLAPGLILHIPALILLLQGRLIRSNILSSGVYIAFITAYATFGQGFHDYGIIAYPIVILFAGVVSRRRGLITSASLIAVALVWLVLEERNGWFNPAQIPAPNWIDLFVAEAAIALAVAAVYLLISDLENRLAQMRREITDRKRAEGMALQQRTLAEALQDVAAALNGTLDYEDVLGKILVNVERVIPIDSANVAVLDDNGLLNYVRFHGYPDLRGVAEDQAKVFSPNASPIFKKVFETGEPLVIPDTRLDPDWITVPSSAWIRSYAVMPIRVKDKVIGVLNLDSAKPGFYAPEQIQSLRAFANHVATAVENAQLFSRAEREASDRKRAEEEVRQLNAALEERVEERTRELREVHERLVRQEKLATLGQVAGSMGHELRNPLGVISNAAYFLKLTQPDAPGKVKEYLDLIQANVGISGKIVADLLELTRSQPVKRTSVPIAETLRQALERFPVPKSVRVALDLPADLPPAYADPGHAVQILGNIILNACQSMPTGGTLTITSVARDEMVCVAIRDEGVGIPAENMEKLFEPLFTTKPQGVGLGLGLAVCQKLIEANGGRIEVESEVGKGSVFTVWLPLARHDAI